MRKKILLAEDSVTIQKVFDLAFEKSDFSVIAVDNGDEVVRVAEEISPDLVVVDVTLPGKDGFEVASELLAGEHTKNFPVLILSGTLNPLDEEKFKACGAKGVLFKPFETIELLEKVGGLIGKREEAPAPVVKPVEPPPPADEPWNFSDVLDEVEETVPAEKPDAAAKAAGEFFPGESAKASGNDAAGYDEFDVSIDDYDEPVAPPAPPAIEEVEEIEELEELEEIAEAPAAVIEPEEPGRERAEEEFFPEQPAPVAPAVSAAPAAAAGDEILQAEMREQFISRAEVIFREVASEAVEKVMWEMMDRLTGEFSAKIRESVEAVAWEVIPATAEALIREEISRIRTQAGKPISS